VSHDPASAEPHGDELLIDAEIDDDAVQSEPIRVAHPWVLLAGLFLIGINLRPALSSLAPVLADVRSTTGLSAAGAGWLNTVPVLCLGVFGTLAPRLANRFDGERVIFYFLLALAAGIALRSLFSIPGLFAGTVLAGASIGVIGVLLPGIVKRDFPERPAAMTGFYTMALCLGAAVAAGATVPLRDRFGGDWQPALVFWAVPATVAAMVWLPQLRTRHEHSTRIRHEVRGLWRDPLAWQVTAYMGLQSSLAYCVFGWFPSILQERGMSALDAGFMLSITVVFQLVTALAAPALATRGKDHRARRGDASDAGQTRSEATEPVSS
jgi:CP family cyanate transporter-like MFS transporter